MPKLIKDPKEQNLYRHPKTGVYYARKFVKGHGELCVSLREKNRHKAKRLKNQVLVEWKFVERPKGRVLFEEVAFELLEIKKMQAYKTFIDYEVHLRLHLLPSYKGIYLDRVAEHWPEHKATQRAKNPYRKLSHDRKHLVSICKLGVLKKYINFVPEFPIDRKDTQVKKAQEYTNDDYKKIHKAIDKLACSKEKWHLIFDMAMFHGMRRSEIRMAKWEYIDWKRGIMILPSEIIKTREDAVIPLEPSILKRLGKIYRDAKSPYIFPHRNDPSLPMTETDKTWQRIKKRAKVKKHFHWTRVTHVTRAIRAGRPAILVQTGVRMSDKVMKQVYLQGSLDDIRETQKAVKGSLE